MALPVTAPILIMLDTSKNNFCNFPFMAVDTSPSYQPCCHNTKFKNIQFDNIDQYWNSPELNDLQKSFQLNKKDPSCNYCWNLENSGQKSLRIESLSRPISDPYCVKQVKLRTGKTCNLSCMSCFSTISSTYQTLWQSDPTWIMPAGKLTDAVYDYDMDSWIRKNHSQIEYIETLGGEPLFSKDFLSLLDFLVESDSAKNITLFLITNGTLLYPSLLSVISKFKKTVFAVSLDAIGQANDYIRWGSDFKKINNNINIIKDFADCSVLPTLSALNIARIHELYEFCDKNNITINNLNLVNHWPQLDPANLPKSLHSLVDSRFRMFLKQSGDSQLLIDFIKKWDQQRNVNIADFMPEWANIVHTP